MTPYQTERNLAVVQPKTIRNNKKVEALDYSRAFFEGRNNMNDYNYVLNNLEVNLTNNEWLRYVKNYFGEEDTKRFCEYVIDTRNIYRKNDIRNIIYSGSMSIYSMIDNEQLAILNYFKPIDTESSIIKNMGLDKAITKYNKKDRELDKEIKKYGYSYSKANFYFKSKNVKDTFQSKYVNVVFSEKSTEAEFLNNIIKIAKLYNQQIVLITDKIPKTKTAKLIIKGKIYNTETREVIKEIENITIEEIEKYLTQISNTKVIYKIPYQKNKKIVNINETKSIVDLDYYSKEKQEMAKKFNPYSYNTAMLKMAFKQKFTSKEYDE